MNNYKDTGRVYTLQDLFDLGLKLEVGDEMVNSNISSKVVKIDSDTVEEWNESIEKSEPKYFVASSKQLDEHLSKGAIKSAEWDGKGLPPVGCVCEYYDDKHSDKWIKVIVNYSSEWGVVVESIDVAKGTELFFNFFENKKFRKLETPEQKAERERLEAAYDLYRIVTVAHGDEAKTIEHFTKFDYKDAWLSAIDKGYRKQ